MTRDLRLDVDGNSAGGQKALDEAAVAVDVLRKQADKLGNEFRQASRDATELDAKLLETKAAAAALAKEFAKTNDSGIKKELAAQRAAVSELQKLRQDIVGDTERDASRAEAAWSKAADGLERDTSRVAKATAREADKAAAETEKAAKKAIATAEKAAKETADAAEKASKQAADAALSAGDFVPSLGPVGIGLGAVAAVPALASAGGALAAGAGLGAIGAGVAGAVAGDPGKFQVVWATAISHVSKNWQDASKVFTGPTLDAIRTIGPMFDGLHIDKTLATAASYVRPLVAGVEGFVVNIEGGVDKLVQKAGPVFTELESVLPDFGAMIADGLGSIADNAEGGAQALGDVIQLVGGVTDGLLHLVAGAEAVYGWFKAIDAEFVLFVSHHRTLISILTPIAQLAVTISKAFSTDEVNHFGAALEGVALTGQIAADQAAQDARKYEELDKALGVTTISANNLADGVGQILGALLAGDHATLSWDESLTGLGEALKQNKGAFDIHSKAGQADREAVLAAVAANVQQYQSILSTTGSIKDATDAYDKNTASIEASLRQSGLNQASIDGLIGKYKSVPDTVKTNIEMKGLTEAIGDLDDVLRRINGLPPRKTVNIVVAVSGQIGLAESLLGAGIIGAATPKAKHKAAGGPTSGLTLVGERGPELINAPTGSYVYNARETASMLAGGDGRPPRIPTALFGGGSAGGSGPPQLVYSGPTTGLDGMFATWLAGQTRAGNVRIHSNAIVN